LPARLDLKPDTPRQQGEGEPLPGKYGPALDHKLQRHEKIRFSRGDFSELGSFPSAAGHAHLMRRRGLSQRLLRLFATVATVCTSLAVIGAVLLYLVATTGLGSDRLGEEAEAAIRNASGLDVDVTLGSAHISIERARLLAVSVPDVRLASRVDGKPLLEAGSIDFGVRALPLLTGSIQLGSARISDAHIFPGAFASSASSDPFATVRNPDGLIDPDLVAPAVFGAVHQLFDAVGAGSTRSIELDHVELVAAPDSDLGVMVIERASLSRASGNQLKFSADLMLDGRNVGVEGSAQRDPSSKLISALSLTVEADAGESGNQQAGDGPASSAAGPPSTEDAGTLVATTGAAVGDRLGPVELTITGVEGEPGTPSRLSLAAAIGTSTFAIDKERYFEGEVKLAASIATGENKMRIERLEIIQGRSDYVLYGPVGPRPGAEGKPPAYRFELASDSSISAPAGSNEPALAFSAMISGTFDPAANRLELPSVDVRTASGGVAARLAVDFAEAKPPGIDLTVSLSKLAVSDLKQLWPFTAAPGARHWALNNLFGGQATNGEVRYQVPPGRIGNGVPLSANEVYGHIQISGARFDITGAIPPMRDAAAAIDFRGNDVDVNFTSGAVFLPEGGSVQATNGRFTIRDAYKPVVIGALEVDVAGDAQSITRLASYEPIDGLQGTGMTPQDFSGKVTGHVSTPIPLIGGADMKDLPWTVSLDFEKLALAKPIEDQLVTEADGNITLDQDKAVVKAQARLNGAPAEIALVEPLRPGGPLASRDITMTLDNQAREAIAPGSGILVDGPVKLSLDTAGIGSGRKLNGDLTDATLSIPWVGWSKGPGVSASVAFTLSKNGETTTLSDFKLAGKTFAIAGDIALSAGGLESAKLGTVQLNRGDDVAVSIQRKGKGFAMDVKGETLDARSLIKLLKSEDKGEEAGSKRPITIDAKVERLTGFHDEVLSGVTVSYAGAGSASGRAKVGGTSASGAVFALEDDTEGGVRSLTMQSKDAGAVLRFLDIYEHMVGGSMKLSLAGEAGGVMTGKVDAVNFDIVDEPKLRSLVSTTPAGSDRSLNDAVKRDIDTSRVRFERAYAWIAKGNGALKVQNGVLRGPLIGSTFQGTLYDPAGNMDMTGTFMPAYGLNRIFGELPLIGAILGNGRDRGLIGVTFRLSGDADKPNLQINPLSVIAPGIFRSIFEFRGGAAAPRGAASGAAAAPDR
jgi:hypothetical protein